MTTTSEVDRVRALVAPIASDLQLDLYDVERRGGTIRVTLDSAPGSAQGITLDELSLASRLISREMDHVDPIAGRYTLEVTSPGLERPLRTPAHYRREVGKEVTLRLTDVVNEERRLRGVLVGADDEAAVVRLSSGEERTIPYASVDKARTVFDWTPKPKPGAARAGGPRTAATSNTDGETERKESP